MIASLRLSGVVVMALFLFVATSAQATAMQFTVVPRADGVRVVLATGDIVPGDAAALRQVLHRGGRDTNGTYELSLDSRGGSVAEALAMADVMDAAKVSTFVTDRHMCGSACATILFVSGEYKTIAGSGELAIHTCFDQSGGASRLVQ